MRRREGPPDGTLEQRLAWRSAHEHVLKIRDAGGSYLRALAARRDAHRLVDVGFERAAQKPLSVLDDERVDMNLDRAIEMAIIKEAADLIDLFDRDPSVYPQGRDAETAIIYAGRLVRRRYARGKCALCKEPALACAKRHGQGKSCA